ncbi:Endonuclease/Exonuclease/phosphatase family protein [Theileria parva strain Muguga]|uniref:sphingomyelin phosphodiesterase n=1 Tax=Theileria parva TaxID=5875 RepID=Q4N6H1_THEPA|nr:Endonuclease/Exonuclease/phosphatase family protein [Theileria parva strain Muguga]EAN34437.1 Endonuclease/Exonuclease/phosphatase family protein [Theileria parva strain Muguga]|eukprot:XP_766720.1 sphingomyelin/lysocholinephospholipid-phospholipase C [Theileria parva strain Muguga]
MNSPLIREDTLSVMSYNVQCIPWYLAPGYNIGIRARILPKYLVELVRKYAVDVLILQECFDRNVFNTFKLALQTLLPFSTDLIGLKNDWDSTVDNSNRWLILTNGGVCIMSRYPILERHQLIFKNCRNTCSLASKGACVAVISKAGKRVNVVGTHLQAYDGPAKTVRQKQYKEIIHWLELLSRSEHGVSDDDPFILAGDLNTCCLTDTPEFKAMLSPREKNFIKFSHTLGDKDPTYCSITNDYCKMCNVDSISSVFDYILAGPGVRVVHPQTVVRDKLHAPIRVRKYYLHCIGTCTMETYNPSDHYPVYSILAF